MLTYLILLPLSPRPALLNSSPRVWPFCPLVLPATRLSPPPFLGISTCAHLRHSQTRLFLYAVIHDHEILLPFRLTSFYSLLWIPDYLLSNGFLLLGPFQIQGPSSLAPPPGRKQDGAAGRGLRNLGSAAPAGAGRGVSSPIHNFPGWPSGSADPCSP